MISQITLIAQESGFDAISQAKGISIAVTGMLIVFFALTIITLFIRLLPIVLGHFEPYLPRLEPHGQAPTAAERLPVDNEKIVAAIGYVLHMEMEKATQSK
ncbi:MAG: OadG family protein [Bythopirellula sp.]